MEDLVLNVTTTHSKTPKQVKVPVFPITPPIGVEKRENAAKEPQDSNSRSLHKKKKLLKASKTDQKTTSYAHDGWKGDRSASNPLQFLSDNYVKRDTDRNRMTSESVPNLENLMSTPVFPRIEPVFTNLSWKEFSDRFNIHRHLLSCLVDRFKLHRLTAIQETTIPAILAANDCLVRAQTGSGKTLAYAVPLLNQLMTLRPPVTRESGPLALIILPTRELATQTFEVFQMLSHACVRIVSGCLIGGMNRKPQKVSLRKGLNVVIGTPQRLLDHILRTSTLRLGGLRYLVIDEADRLLEMGFEKSVRQIIGRIQTVSNSVERTLRTILISATLTPGVEELAGLTLCNPVQCVVQEDGLNSHIKNAQHIQPDSCKLAGLSSDRFAMPSGLRHFFLVVPWKLRLPALAAFLLLKCRYHKNGGKLIVFMATQDCVDFHFQLFSAALNADDDQRNIVPAHASRMSLFRLHGNMEHSERETVFHQFSTSDSGILITTDVASRGLDLASVSWVVQYHVTGSLVDYIHRVGRTARAGGRGKALLFLDEQELNFTETLRIRAGVLFESLVLSDLMQTALFHMCRVKRSGKAKPTVCTTVEEAVSQFSHLLLDTVAEDPVINLLAETAYTSFLRSYASFSGEMRVFFTFKKLHLGHVARAFCLQATPKDVAARVSGRSALKTSRSKLTRKRLAIPENEQVSNAALGQPRDEKRPKRTMTVTKPRDVAKRNMLAEYGL